MYKQNSMSAHREVPNQTGKVFPDELMLQLSLSRTVGVS